MPKQDETPNIAVAETPEITNLTEAQAPSAGPMKRVYTGIPNLFENFPKSADKHYVIVREHPGSWGIGSTRLKFERMGYKVEQKIKDAEIYLMSVPLPQYEAYRQEIEDLARDARTGGRDYVESIATGAKNTYTKTKRHLSPEELQPLYEHMNA